jgi:hypothetical protein
MAGPPGVVDAAEGGEWGPVLELDGYDPAPAGVSTRFPGASHAFITSVTGPYRRLELYAFDVDGFQRFQTGARSTWIGNDLITLVPLIEDLPSDPIRWDAYASWSVHGLGTSSDSLRSAAGLMKAFETAPDFWLDPIPSFGP